LSSGAKLSASEQKYNIRTKMIRSVPRMRQLSTYHLCNEFRTCPGSSASRVTQKSYRCIFAKIWEWAMKQSIRFCID